MFRLSSISVSCVRIACVAAFAGLLAACETTAVGDTETVIAADKVGLKTYFSSASVWPTSITDSQAESTACAVTPKNSQSTSALPKAIICVRTQYEQSEIALAWEQLNKASLGVLLSKTCKTLQCDPIAERGSLTEKSYGSYTGFEHVAYLADPAHVKANIENSVFFVARNPFGQMITFSLHTEKDQLARHRPVFESVIKNAVYTQTQVPEE